MPRNEKGMEERERDGKRVGRESTKLKKPQKQWSKVEILVAQLVGILFKQVEGAQAKEDQEVT